jgi:hypothetical protein
MAATAPVCQLLLGRMHDGDGRMLWRRFSVLRETLGVPHGR